MQTYREVISDIVSELKAVNLDDRYSYRFLCNKLQDAANQFLKIDSEYRKIFKNNSFFYKIDCFPLTEIPLIDCGCDLNYIGKVMKSCKPLPVTFESTYGNIVKILTLDFSKEFTKIEPFTYKDFKNRKYGPKNFYWIIDNYVYIPDSEIEDVYVLGAFKYKNDVDVLNGVSNECFSFLDSPFNFPDYMVSLIKNETIKTLVAANKQIIEDVKPNLNQNDK
jgi:hypothetical protein